MANNPTATRSPGSAKNWRLWALEQARRQGQLEMLVLRSTRKPGPATEPARQQRRRKRRVGVFG